MRYHFYITACAASKPLGFHFNRLTQDTPRGEIGIRATKEEQKKKVGAI